MKSAAERLLTEATAFIAVAESGDAKIAAYTKAADRIIKAQEKDPQLSQRLIGERIGKSGDWVSKLVRWRTNGDYNRHPPFGGPDSREAQRRFAERQEPTRHEDRVEMGRKLLSDPRVVRGVLEDPKANRRVEQEISKRHAAERKQRMDEAAARARSEAAPLSAYMSSMIVKVNEWSAALLAVEPELAALPEGPARDTVLDVFREHLRQTQRCVAALEDRPQIEDVIEAA